MIRGLAANLTGWTRPLSVARARACRADADLSDSRCCQGAIELPSRPCYRAAGLVAAAMAHLGNGAWAAWDSERL